MEPILARWRCGEVFAETRDDVEAMISTVLMGLVIVCTARED